MTVPSQPVADRHGAGRRAAGHRTIAALLAVSAGAGLAACAPTVSLQPAEDAASPACAAMSARLPGAVAGAGRRSTNAQATGAWGTPASAIITCGVSAPLVSSQTCITVGDVDWLVDDSSAPTYRFTSYGRDPAVQLVVDGDAVNGNTVLNDLADAVGAIPATRRCT